MPEIQTGKCHIFQYWPFFILWSLLLYFGQRKRRRKRDLEGGKNLSSFSSAHRLMLFPVLLLFLVSANGRRVGGHVKCKQSIRLFSPSWVGLDMEDIFDNNHSLLFVLLLYYVSATSFFVLFLLCGGLCSLHLCSTHVCVRVRLHYLILLVDGLGQLFKKILKLFL